MKRQTDLPGASSERTNRKPEANGEGLGHPGSPVTERRKAERRFTALIQRPKLDWKPRVADRRKSPEAARKEKISNVAPTKETQMLAKFSAVNNLDAQGRPAGGTVSGTGLSIQWQDGPLGRGADRVEPNGAFVETVIAAALQRIEHYQSSPFKCRENALAITKLEEALHWLHSRTNRRETQGVEGTHAGT